MFETPSIALSRPKVLRFGCQDTRKNLPAASSAKRGEVNFLGKFERAYFAGISTGDVFACGRELALNGYGRADLIWLAWESKERNGDFSAMALQGKICITAIEAKLKDWRKGLMQAANYRHFANRSILVLPPKAAATALKYLPTFKSLHVGLWEFDADRGILLRHSTPRKKKPLSDSARERAMKLIMAHTNFSRKFR